MARDNRNSFKDALHGLLHPFEAAARRREQQRQAGARREAEERRARARREHAGRKAEQRTHQELEKLTRRGCYYVFSDLPTLHAGNIDHLVVGPEGLTIVETKANSGTIEAHPAAQGKLTITVGGKPLHRDPVNQIRSQMWDVCLRAGMKTGPDNTEGMNWVVCFPSGTLGQGLPRGVRVHIATTTDLLTKVRARGPGGAAGERRMDEAAVEAVAWAVSSIYGRPPSASPARRTGPVARSTEDGTGHKGRQGSQ